ncbi:MAG: AMP-binding protein [Syntrophomonas sp.]|nr:AMP-binding protein [Syntrophomonas sp.]
MIEKGKEHYVEKILSLKQVQNISLGSELEKLAVQQPEHPAIINNERTITYKQFNALANRYANFFREQGFKKGDVVALMMENRPEFLITVTGLSKLGVITSLINIAVRGEVLADSINKCEARAVIIGHEMLDLFKTIEERIRLRAPARLFIEAPNRDFVIPDGFENLNIQLQNISDANPDTTGQITTDDILVYIFSAGNTGWRKASPVTQRRWLKKGFEYVAVANLNHNTVQYMCLHLYYNMAFNICFSSMILSGSTMVLKRDFSLQSFWDDIHKYNANYFISVSEMARYILSLPEKSEDAHNPIENMICNGIWGNLIETFRKRYQIKHIFENYGTTEGIGTFINYEEILDMCGNLTLLGIRQGELVRCDPISDEIIYDAEGRAVKCSPGEAGLLIGEINELNRYSGYLHEPEASESRLLRNVFQDGDLYFNSGDLLKLHENDYISFIDRLGDTYRWKGETVSASQVADVILKFFGPIDECFVYGVRIPGNEGRCGMAAIKLLEDQKLDLKKLLAHIDRRMPRHARPIFIRIYDKLDTSENQQLLKKQLQQESFDLNLISDPMYFLDPGKNQYVPLTTEIYNMLLNKQFRL